MAEEQKRGPGRPRKDTQERIDEASKSSEFGGASYAQIDEQFERLNEIDERLPDRRPGTMADRDTGAAFEDNRKFAGDLGKAANQMVGRAFITENTSPHPANVNEQSYVEGDGQEVVIKRNYQPHPAREGGPLPAKLVVGTITRMPLAEAKKLIKLGAAEFTDED